MKRLRKLMLAALAAHLDGGRPRAPEAGRLVWEMFARLSNGRRYDGGVPLAITQGEFAQAEQRGGARWPPDLVAILWAMDAAWLDHMRRPVEEKAEPLTAAAFDAAFG